MKLFSVFSIILVMHLHTAGKEFGSERLLLNGPNGRNGDWRGERSMWEVKYSVQWGGGV